MTRSATAGAMATLAAGVLVFVVLLRAMPGGSPETTAQVTCPNFDSAQNSLTAGEISETANSLAEAIQNAFDVCNNKFLERPSCGGGSCTAVKKEGCTMGGMSSLNCFQNANATWTCQSIAGKICTCTWQCGIGGGGTVNPCTGLIGSVTPPATCPSRAQYQSPNDIVGNPGNNLDEAIQNAFDSCNEITTPADCGAGCKAVQKAGCSIALGSLNCTQSADGATWQCRNRPGHKCTCEWLCGRE